MSMLLSDSWSSSNFNLPDSVFQNNCTPSSDDTDLSDSNPVFFNHELLEVMRENSESSFTDTVNQTKALKSHILSKLELSQNEIKDCDQDLNEKIRKFASKASRIRPRNEIC